MKLNADLGESFGAWKLQNDEALMPYIHMANIACGGHAGDANSMVKAIKSTLHHKVEIGAHPSYPDIQGFGRRSMNIDSAELIHLVCAQIATLDGLAKCYGQNLSHVKPHGALYNDAMSKPSVRTALFKAMKLYHRQLPIMLQATSQQSHILLEAKEYDVSVIFEAFADRAYQDDGLLTPRTRSGAVLELESAFLQAKQIIETNTVTTLSGKTISLAADSICIHGDTPSALELAERLSQLLACR
ncbi:5-oxoprolinase subunit PxpA [Glaciecola sp. MH2013]|uniref:5-oxoprolinase subunit PxpA n=1 Tax=Glaciecola sp. MH2013 TaxID=2785524 RepID=UPI00189F4FB7|nr:5-oxoprolinase subunit PxpA [Glaciecola sp. MH2013]MBF7072740.1 5-oxoprolinase subunit PxpA [Glaciecola sp. MH2013]